MPCCRESWGPGRSALRTPRPSRCFSGSTGGISPTSCRSSWRACAWPTGRTARGGASSRRCGLRLSWGPFSASVSCCTPSTRWEEPLRTLRLPSVPCTWVGNRGTGWSLGSLSHRWVSRAGPCRAGGAGGHALSERCSRLGGRLPASSGGLCCLQQLVHARVVDADVRGLADKAAPPPLRRIADVLPSAAAVFGLIVGDCVVGCAWTITGLAGDLPSYRFFP